MKTIEEILAAQQVIVDAAKAENRSLTDDEVTQFEALEAEGSAINRTKEIEKRQAAYTAPNATLQAAVNVGTVKQDDGLDVAFRSYLRTGQANADLAELRAQSEGIPSAGGYLVPEGFRNKIIERMKAFGGIANVVETITTDTGQPYPWATVDDTANLGEIVSEGNTFSSGADLTLGTATLGAYTYTAGGGSNAPLRVSIELLQDSAFDVEGLVSRKLGERIARLQSAHLVTGTGSGQPLGISTGLTGVEIAANTGIVYDDLINWIHSVDPAYRDSGTVWAFNDRTLAVIKKLKDSHGDPIWRPADADMATTTGGGTLLGYPVIVDQAFPDVNLSSNTVNFGVFGDLVEAYVIRRVRDIQLIVDPITRMVSNRQVQYSAYARMDATQQNTSAYIALTGQA